MDFIFMVIWTCRVDPMFLLLYIPKKRVMETVLGYIKPNWRWVTGNLPAATAYKLELTIELALHYRFSDSSVLLLSFCNADENSSGNWQSLFPGSIGVTAAPCVVYRLRVWFIRAEQRRGELMTSLCYGIDSIQLCLVCLSNHVVSANLRFICREDCGLLCAETSAGVSLHCSRFHLLFRCLSLLQHNNNKQTSRLNWNMMLLIKS